MYTLISFQLVIHCPSAFMYTFMDASTACVYMYMYVDVHTCTRACSLCVDPNLQNLGHMTGPPVYIGGSYPHIQLNYTGGDDCSEGVAGQKHSTTVSLTCGPGTSVSLHMQWWCLCVCAILVCTCTVHRCEVRIMQTTIFPPANY